MSKKRKLHQLIVTITSAYQGTSKRKEPFYFLNIEQETILGTKKDTVYAFSSLVSRDFWKVLEKQSFKDKKYLFYCENRTRG
jgi:hypothetical protein